MAGGRAISGQKWTARGNKTPLGKHEQTEEERVEKQASTFFANGGSEDHYRFIFVLFVMQLFAT